MTETATTFQYDDGPETLEAIRVVRKHLADNWISDGCRDHTDRMFGCVSCQAAVLDDALASLQNDIECCLPQATS